MSHLSVSRWGEWRGMRPELAREAEVDPVRPWGGRDASWAGWSGTDGQWDRLLESAWESGEDPSAINRASGWGAWAFATGLVVSDGTTWWQEALSRHSGTIEALDRVSGLLVIGEAGGGGRGEKAEVTRRRNITVISSTDWVRVRGAKSGGLSGWRAEFTGPSIAPWQAKVGDGVTVHARRDGRSLVALKIAVVAPEG